MVSCSASVISLQAAWSRDQLSKCANKLFAVLFNIFKPIQCNNVVKWCLHNFDWTIYYRYISWTFVRITLCGILSFSFSFRSWKDGQVELIWVVGYMHEYLLSVYTAGVEPSKFYHVDRDKSAITRLCQAVTKFENNNYHVSDYSALTSSK